MRYQGGKSHIAKPIAEIINRAGGTTFVSLFCGSCVIESLVNADKKILNDKHEYLIAMYKALQNGYELPENLTKEEYQDIKANKDRDKALTGFVGFGCSFGGKWFGGYAKNSKNTNYCKQSKTSVLKTMQGLNNATFICADYKQVGIPANAIIYADPPYMNTTQYSNSKNFNYNEFWDYMRQLSKDHIVFISEENAPEDFECIWQKEVRRTLDSNKNNMPKKTEKLFVWKGNKNEN